MFVKPGENREIPGARLRVRIPRTFALLSEAGEDVPDNFFWRWMLRHGDVVLVEPPPSDQPQPPAEPAQSES